ncbi:MAG: recombinase A [Acidobacteria bacterium]|nr:recombinase A [Acidobacteriota bacterium]
MDQRIATAGAGRIVGRAGCGGPYNLTSLAGRLSELSGIGPAAQLSLAFTLVGEAHKLGEPAAWVTDRKATFFPPDVVEGGVDLARLPVVFVPDAAAGARAAERLVRSGGFGLVVLDLVGARAEIPAALQSRLVGLAQKHDAALVVLTEKAADAGSLGSLFALRCEARREPAGEGRFLCLARALKDKRGGPGWTYTEVRRGPLGLR